MNRRIAHGPSRRTLPARTIRTISQKSLGHGNCADIANSAYRSGRTARRVADRQGSGGEASQVSFAAATQRPFRCISKTGPQHRQGAPRALKESHSSC